MAISSKDMKHAINLIQAGRGTGKTRMVREYIDMLAKKTPFEILTKGLVDEEQWYTIRCINKEVANWVRDQPCEQWYEHIDNRGYIDLRVFDIHEELLTMLTLRWS